ncbi:hypothetical protein B0H14DRAFT_82678 [Mycena olivaceomarginata]|nr:hypothetical protein B0H14DRAFT_82678 [Mycena olivaceomarginata]
MRCRLSSCRLLVSAAPTGSMSWQNYVLLTRTLDSVNVTIQVCHRLLCATPHHVFTFTSPTVQVEALLERTSLGKCLPITHTRRMKRHIPVMPSGGGIGAQGSTHIVAAHNSTFSGSIPT